MKSTRKKILLRTFIVLFLFIIILIPQISGITGALGNARMILRADVGDTIEKYILVKNINDVPVDITLSSSGELAEDIEILEPEFTLQSGEEKKAYFILEVTKEGQTEGKINVEFIPEEGESVSLSSTIIVIVGDSGSIIQIDDYPLDTDSDGLYDYLIVEVEVNITEEGNYEVEGELLTQSGNQIQDDVIFWGYLDIGIHTLELNFNGKDIHENKENGPYELEISLFNEDTDITVDELEEVYTSNYNYEDFEKPELEVIENFTDYGIDTNENGLFEKLIIKVPVKVNVAGAYWIEAELDDIDLGVNKEISLDIDDEFIYLEFDGTSIYESGIDGQYELEDFVIENDNSVIYNLREEYLTSNYNSEDFEPIIIQETEIIFPKNNSTIKGDFTSLVVETNKDAVCKYGVGFLGSGYGGASYPKQMEITGNHVHMQSIEDLKETQEGEKYFISVTCTDEFGNSENERTYFYVDLSELEEVMILEDIGDYEYLRSIMFEVPEPENDMINSMYFVFYNKTNDNFFYSVGIFEFNNLSWTDEFLEEFEEESHIENVNGQGVYVYNDSDSQIILWPHENLLVFVMALQDIERINEIDDIEPITMEGLPSPLIQAYLSKYPSDLQVIYPDTSPPIITLLSPDDNYETKTSESSKNIYFNYKVSDESEIASCDLIIDGIVKETKANVQRDIETIFSVDLSRDSYEWQMKCTDSKGNQKTSETRSLKIKKKSSSHSSSSSSFSKITPTVSVQKINLTSNSENKTEEVQGTIFLGKKDDVIRLGVKKVDTKKESFFEKIINWFKRLFFR